MVEHLVLFKMKPEAAGRRDELIQALRGLKSQVPGIVDLSCGANFSDRSQGFDVGLTVRFTDRAALDAYGPHAEHQAVVQQYVRPLTQEVIVVDYEIG